jgi:hypothetical protein
MMSKKDYYPLGSLMQEEHQFTPFFIPHPEGTVL